MHLMLRWVAIMVTALPCLVSAQSHVPEPAVNLGDTSFLDAVGGTGLLAEQIVEGVHADKVADSCGAKVPNASSLNSVSGLTHIAWVTPHRVLGAWYGAEIVVSAAHVNAGLEPQAGGLGALTVSPLILQWGKKTIGHIPIYQRVVWDFDLPTGTYSRTSAVNIGSKQYDVHPYYSITAMPIPRLETSWRVHYLWSSANNQPSRATAAQSTQAGQAIHFNATLAYQVGRSVWIGSNAYYLQQITDGQVDGVSQHGSPEQVAALGPGLVVNPGKWFVYANAYHEFAAKNRSEGNKIVLRVGRVF